MKNEENQVEVFELAIDETGKLGVNCVSLVNAPAIDVNFVALSKETKIEFTSVETEEKKMLYGALLIPEQLIYRVDKENNKPYYVKYSKETIERVSQDFLKRNMHHNSNLEHSLPVAGLTIVESWLVGQPDKSQQFGFSLPEGTWFVGMKVDNEEIWQDVKNGTFKGFSIEGFFEEMNSEYLAVQEIEKILTEMQDELNGL